MATQLRDFKATAQGCVHNIAVVPISPDFGGVSLETRFACCSSNATDGELV
jgi:3-polyprenyl-4-hydroxybenzoate decarboxylase